MEKIAFAQLAARTQRALGTLKGMVKPTAEAAHRAPFTRVPYNIPATRIPGQAGFTREAVRRGPVVARAEQAGVGKAENLEKMLREGKITKQEAAAKMGLGKSSPTTRLRGRVAPTEAGTVVGGRPTAPPAAAPAAPPTQRGVMDRMGRWFEGLTPGQRMAARVGGTAAGAGGLGYAAG